MKSAFPTRPKHKGDSPKSAALRIAAIYAAIGVCWILVSDLLLFHDAAEEYNPELWGGIIKGILFVLGSAGLMFWLLLRELSHKEQAHEELQFIQLLNELSNDPVYVLDPSDDFRLVYVNEAAVRHFGYSREKLLTMRIRDWDPEYAEAGAKEKWEKLRVERFAVFQSEHHLADGSVVPVEISTNYIEFRGKEYAGGYFRNISSRQKAERDLRESQAMLQEVVNTVPQAIFWKSTKGVYLGCNQVLARDAGLKSPEQIIGKTDYDLPWGKTEAEAYRADDRTVVSSGQPKRHIIEPLTRHDGSLIWLTTSKAPLKNPDGSVFGVLGIYEDITERKLNEERLRESEERLRLATKAAGLGIWDIDLLTQKTVWDKQLIKIYGVDETKLNGTNQDWEKIVHPEDWPRVQAEISKALAEDGEYSSEYRIVRPNGEVRNIRSAATIIRNDKGEPVRALGINYDVTVSHQTRALLDETQKTARLGGWEYLVTNQKLIWTDETYHIHELPPGTPVDVSKAIDYYAGESKTKIRQVFEHLLTTGEGYDCELQFITAKGNQLWVRCTGQADFIDGKPHRVFGIIQDITAQHQAQEELRESEQLFAAVFNSSLDGLFLVDWDTRLIVDCNARAMSLFEAGDKSEMIGQAGYTWHETPWSEDEHSGIYEAIKAGGEWSAEVHYRTLKGNQFWGHFAARKLNLESENIVLVRVADITERKKMALQLENQLRFKRTLINSIPLPIFIKNTQSLIIDCNTAFEKFFGVNRNDFDALDVRDIAPENLAELYAQKDRELLAKPGTQTYEGQVPTAGGDIRDVIIHKATFVGQDGHIAGIVGAILDITQLRQAQGSLLLQESALNAAANGIVITDPEGHIVWANPAFSTLTGYTVKEVIGLNPNVLKSGRQNEHFYEQMWQTIKAGHVWHGELVNKRKDGTPYDEEMTITPVKDAEGNIINFIAIKQDITERKQLEGQYLRAQRMEGIGLLAGGIAHDLNNVLAPILMSIQLLQEMHPDEETQNILTTLQTTTQRGADIVRQVLTFARGIKGDRILLEPKHLIKDILRVAKEAFPRNIHSESKIAPDLWNIVGDPTQLHQVLLNLAINARDAMPDGGVLSIQAANGTGSNEPCSQGMSIAPGEYVIISVKDTGVGIPPYQIDKIFEPFFTTKDTGKGTGLGLSTVMGIVKSHRGYIKVNSAPGKGTEFMIYLPAAKARLPQPDENTENVLPSGHGEVILVVDDEPSIREVAKDILLRKNYHVLVAGDGTEALAAVAQNPDKIDLIITDIMMPFMDGVALARALRKIKPEIKIITCSGLSSGASMVSKLEELKHMGIPNILHKPFTAQVLLEYVQRALDGESLGPDSTNS